MAGKFTHQLHKAILSKYPTVREFSSVSGIDHSQVYRIFRGGGVQLQTAQRMAAALEITLDGFADLVLGKEAA